MNLILIEPHEGAPAGGTVRVTGERARHIREVLRAEPGTPLRLGLLDGPFGTGVVRALAPQAVELDCTWEPHRPPRPPRDLLLALPRPKVLKRLWAQLAALGVDHLWLTNAAKVERAYFDTHVLDPATYGPLLREGLQQVRDTRLPQVALRRQLKIFVEDELDALSPPGVRLLADVDAPVSPREALAGAPAGARVLLAVGPEGGWTDYERALFGRHGFTPVGLGPRALRTDTACLALLALVADAQR